MERHDQIIFSATPKFEKVAAEVFGSDLKYWDFQDYLRRNPAAGDLIPGTGGARKLRWQDPTRGEGKRGGLRVVYFWFQSHLLIVCISAYGKGVKKDLSAEDRAVLRDYSAKLRQELERRTQR